MQFALRKGKAPAELSFEEVERFLLKCDTHDGDLLSVAAPSYQIQTETASDCHGREPARWLSLAVRDIVSQQGNKKHEKRQIVFLPFFISSAYIQVQGEIKPLEKQKRSQNRRIQKGQYPVQSVRRRVSPWKIKK